MKFSLSVLSVAALAATFVAAAPIGARDVWDPTIVYPHAGTVWHAGETHHVQWKTGDAPKNISNGAAIYLRKGDLTSDRMFHAIPPFFVSLSYYAVSFLADPLAKGFDLRKGTQTIVVPHDIAPGSDYRIVCTSSSSLSRLLVLASHAHA